MKCRENLPAPLDTYHLSLYLETEEGCGRWTSHYLIRDGLSMYYQHSSTAAVYLLYDRLLSMARSLRILPA